MMLPGIRKHNYYSQDQRTDAMTLHCRTSYPAQAGQSASMEGSTNASAWDYGSSFPRSAIHALEAYMVTLEHLEFRSRVPGHIVRAAS
jgi:hypothetical protein